MRDADAEKRLVRPSHANENDGQKGRIEEAKSRRRAKKRRLPQVIRWKKATMHVESVIG